MANIYYDVENGTITGLPTDSTDKSFIFHFDFGSYEDELVQTFTLSGTITDEKRIELGADFLTDSDTRKFQSFYPGEDSIPIHESLTQLAYNKLVNDNAVDDVKVYFLTDVAPQADDLTNLNTIETDKWEAINDAINLIQRGTELLES